MLYLFPKISSHLIYLLHQLEGGGGGGSNKKIAVGIVDILHKKKRTTEL